MLCGGVPARYGMRAKGQQLAPGGPMIQTSASARSRMHQQVLLPSRKPTRLTCNDTTPGRPVKRASTAHKGVSSAFQRQKAPCDNHIMRRFWRGFTQDFYQPHLAAALGGVAARNALAGLLAPACSGPPRIACASMLGLLASISPGPDDASCGEAFKASRACSDARSCADDRTSPRQRSSVTPLRPANGLGGFAFALTRASAAVAVPYRSAVAIEPRLPSRHRAEPQARGVRPI